MKARELTASVRPARESDEWASQSIEERLQRDIDINRVRKTIVPYLAQHPDRFFGSFIVLVPKGTIDFEPLTKLVHDLPAAYQTSIDSIGFLTIKSGELIALDGQHRLVAFREVITGDGAKLGPLANSVGDDEVCVLFIEEESTKKTRTIFNKVNRHAKPTGRSDNIITSESDGCAIVARWLLDKGRGAPLGPRDIDGVDTQLVTWTKTSLTRSSRFLTTISAVYETVKHITLFSGFDGFDEKDDPNAPPDEQLEAAYQVVAEWWDKILRLQGFRDALNDLGSLSNIRFANDDPRTLLLRPIGQVALVNGLIGAIDRSRGKLTLDEALRRADLINWSATPQSCWRDTIVRPDGRMNARKEAVELAGSLVSYLIGSEYMDEGERDKLWRSWNTARGKDCYAAIDDLETDDEIPEDLPAPVPTIEPKTK